MINKVILMGRLTRDPEKRVTSSNTAVTTFGLAVDRNVRRTNDATQQTADFFDVVCWEQKAEFAANYFHKGSAVAVVGRLQSRKWQDKQGNNRISIEVVADELHFAESRRDNDSYQNQNQNPYGGGYGYQNNQPQRTGYSQPAGYPQQGFQQPAEYGMPAPAYGAPVKPEVEPDGFESLTDDDSELPF